MDSPYERLVCAVGGPGVRLRVSALAEAARAFPDDIAVRRVVGDAHLLMRRFEEALPWYDSADDLQRLLRLGLGWGRYRLVETLRQRGLVPDEQWRRFLRERALPALPMGGDARRGFHVDERIAAAIAQELGEPVKSLLAQTVRRMMASGSRNVAKLYVLSRLADDPELTRLTEPPFQQRTDDPRAQLPVRVARLVAEREGEMLGVLQAGDEDDYDPKSAWLWAARLFGREVVIKEHLRIPIDWGAIPGTSDEAAVLASLSHPGVVQLLGIERIGRHELMVLPKLPGSALAAHISPQTLLAPESVQTIGAAIAQSLSALHASGVLYLDLKPANVVCEGDVPVLVDFGMAQRGVTEVRSLLSTARYASPERVRTRQATAASDVFALGLLLCELQTGLHPFALEAPEQTRQTASEDREDERLRYALANAHAPLRTDALPPHMRDLLAAMLADNPAARPLSSTLRETLGPRR